MVALTRSRRIRRAVSGSLLLQQLQHIVNRHTTAQVAAFEQAVGQGAFVLVQGWCARPPAKSVSHGILKPARHQDHDLLRLADHA